MGVYFFDLFEGQEVSAEEGQECADLDEAIARAVHFARDIAAEEVRTGRLDLGHYIAVRDEAGAVIAKVTFGQAVTIN